MYLFFCFCCNFLFTGTFDNIGRDESSRWPHQRDSRRCVLQGFVLVLKLQFSVILQRGSSYPRDGNPIGMSNFVLTFCTGNQAVHATFKYSVSVAKKSGKRKGNESV